MVVVAVAAAVALFFVLREDGGDGATEAPAPAAEQPGGEESRDGVGDGQGSGSRPSRPHVPTVEIVDGEPRDGPLELSVESGEEVRFRVDSDTPGEVHVHVHGYEVFKEVEAGETAGIAFPAEIEGAFEVEMHRFSDGGHVEIASLEVNP